MDKLRGPTQIVFNITNRCNLQCSHCFNRSGKIENELTDAEVINLIKEIIKIKPWNVCFSGGEPLLRKNLLFDCIDLLTENNIRSVILSNGSLLNENTINKLKNLKVQEIELSLDGATEEQHDKIRGKGHYKQVINALEKLRELEFPRYVVSMTINPHNYDKIKPTILLLKKIGTPIIVFRPMLVCGRASSYLEDLILNPIQYRNFVYEVNKLKSIESDIEIAYLNPLSIIFKYCYSPTLDYFGMEIKANGDIIVSPYIQLILGNIKRHTITDYWNKGYSKVWQIPIIRNLVNRVNGFSFIEIEKEIQKIGKVDLIDDF